MSLTKDKIIKNAKKYFDTGTKYGFMTEELQNFLGADIIGAPATTKTELYNSYEGGLIEHILLVTKYAVSINSLLPDESQIPLESLIKVCCLHQIGKTFLYIPQTSDWHVKNGINYSFSDKVISMRVGERSLYYATKYGVSFTEEEYQAIMNHDKDDTDKQSKWFSEKLSIVLKQAIELAILENKKFL